MTGGTYKVSYQWEGRNGTEYEILVPVRTLLNAERLFTAVVWLAKARARVLSWLAEVIR